MLRHIMKTLGLFLFLVLILPGASGCAKPPDAQSFILAENTPMETRLVLLEGAGEGPCLFVIAGIHGDEVAGWHAARQLAQELEPARGTVYILSPANAYGAQNDVRRTWDNRDLNRTFPGMVDGDATQNLAWEIFDWIDATQPALVLDLHEARPKRENRDYLGNSIIFTSATGIEDFIFAILEQTASGILCSEPFTYFDSAPAGSINYEATTRLGTPVITIETFREDPLETRIQNHMDLVYFAAEYYGLL